MERHRLFLSAIQQHEENQLAVEETLLKTVKNVLSLHSLHELEDDSGYYHAVFAEELVALTVADTQLGHIGSDAESVNPGSMVSHEV